jgi:hypothetical protein
MLASVTEDLGQPARDAEIKRDVERDREFRVRRRNRGIETGAAVARDIEAAPGIAATSMGASTSSRVRTA